MNLAILDQYVFVCPQFGQEFQTLQDYLDYSEGQHDYLISDYLGSSYHFSSIADYQHWVRDELLAKGKTLKQWVREQQTLETNRNYNHVKAYRLLLQFSDGRRQFLRLARTELWKSIRRANAARKVALT